MRAVDPSIELVVDGEFMDPEANRLIASNPRMRGHFRWVTNHKYGPWGTERITAGGEEVDGSGLDAATLHRFCVWFPAGIRPDGRSIGLDDWVFELAPGLGYEVASTEWNWNGWGPFDQAHPRVTAHARALGAAGFLHDLLRRAGSGPGGVTLATQSVLGTPEQSPGTGSSASERRWGRGCSRFVQGSRCSGRAGSWRRSVATPPTPAGSA